MSVSETLKHWLLKAYVGIKNRKRQPQFEGALELKGLKKAVDIKRNGQGVPFIYAENRHDLFFSQGFVHAQDRLWQIEINRLIACGRLSERFGKGALETDRLSRTLGFYRQAKKDHALISDELRDCLAAYCAGINAFLDAEKSQLPVEFSLLKYRPEPYTPLEALAFSRLMTFQLSNGWAHEFARERLIRVLGPEIAAEFDIRTNPNNPQTLPIGNEHNRRAPDGRLQAMNGPYLRQMGASNAWVVNGERTDTGEPILANDPHLSALMPSIWYQVYMEAPDFRVQGVSIPGIPLVMIGHNADIAWGVTMGFTDIQDIFIEEFVDESTYRTPTGTLAAEQIEERIRVKDALDETHTVLLTQNGPVISGLLPLPDLESQQVYVLKSPALDNSRFTMGWHQIDQAKDWDSFLEGLRHLNAPGLNLVYADRKGNIGYWMTGNTPVRKKGKGEVPRPGWTGEYGWEGWVPFEEMPHALNPEKGWIVSANHRVVDEDFPHFMGNIWMNGYRAKRIEALLLGKSQLKVGDMGPIMTDLWCDPGKRFADCYAHLDDDWSPLAGKALAYLQTWDGFLSADSIAGTIYEYSRKELTRLLLAPWSEEKDLIDWYLGKGPSRVMFRVAEFQGRETNALFDLLENPESKVLIAAGGKEKVLRNALEAAVKAISAELGPDPGQWQWGKIHQVQFGHALGVRPDLGRIFNVGPFPIGGDSDTVCQTSMQPEEGYSANLALPSYRQVVDMADFNRSTWIMPPGNCGHYQNPHRDDQVDAWRFGRQFPMVWDAKEVDAHTKYRLHLNPLS